MSGFEGALFGGMQAARVPVRVEQEGSDLVIRGADGERRVALVEVNADAPIPAVTRLLHLPGGELIETDDYAAVAALWPPQSAVARTAFWLESRWSAVIGCIALTAFAAWLIVAFALPLAAKPVAESISPQFERAMGEHALATLDRTALRPSRLLEDRQEELREQFDRLTTDEQMQARYDLKFRKAGAPNAFALPGGIIIVTDEMAEAVENEDEFAAVVAHEIGHVRNHHALRLILQDSGLIVLITAIAGDAVSTTVLAAALPAALLQAHYSRRFEAEADDYAFALLKRHHRSPQAFADLLRRLEKRHGAFASKQPVLEYLSTHPATEERIERAEQQR
jgi:predicted Zn-dependent protease